MNMNILVPFLEGTGYFRDQKPVICTLAHKPFTHHVQPLLPLQHRGRAITASMEEPFGTLHSPHLNLCPPSLSSGTGVRSLEQGTAGLASPRSPRSPARRRVPLPQGWPTSLTSTTRSCHLEEQETGTRSQYCPPRGIPKPRHALVTYGEFFGMVKEKSMVVRVHLLVTFR